jgi:hypothetical protein
MRYKPQAIMSCFCRVAALLMAVGSLSAQEPKKEKERHGRFLAVGETPPFRQEIRDDTRYELEPPPGSIPPREVLLGFDDQTPDSVALRLGQITAPVKVPAGAGTLLLRRRDDASDSEPWFRVNRPESGDFLVILWRDQTTGSWEKARSLVLSDDPVSFPAGSVRVVNISPATVRIVIGNEKLILNAGKSFLRVLPKRVEQLFQILLPTASGSLLRLHSGVITQNPGERSFVIVYRADGESSRRPLKVKVQREPVPPLPEKKEP